MASSLNQPRSDPVRSRSRSPRPRPDDDDDDVIVVFSDVPPSSELLDDSQEDVIGDPLNEEILQKKIGEWMSEQLTFPERFRGEGKDMASRILRLRRELEESKREIEEWWEREMERARREEEEATSQ